MNNNHLCLFESRDSEAETIPDEDYNNLLGRNKKEVNSWHVGVSNRPKLNEGPNINLKYFKKKYDTEEEKHFITKKIRTKKKLNYVKIGKYIMIVILKMNVVLLMVLMN